MAGWSKIADGSALDCLKTLQKLRTNEFCLDFESGLKSPDDENKLRCLFEQLLCFFLEEICGSDCFRHLPPMLGDGKSVDLFKLYLKVRERGGYEAVSRNGLWDSVAQESGLTSDVGSAVKLVYLKYLDTLDIWLKSIVKEKKLLEEDSCTDLSGGLMELDHQKKDREYPYLDFTDFGKLCNENEVLSSVESDDDRKCVDDTQNVCDGKDDIISDASVVMEEVASRKRKRESHQRMLDWVIGVAKDPCNQEVGSLPERYKWKSYGTDEFWKQVLLAREALFLKRYADINADTNLLMKQKMHPSMYDDHTGSERPRSSQRVLPVREPRAVSSKKSLARAGSEASSGTQSDLEDNFDRESNPMFYDNYNRNRKRVPVGPFFQAKVPEWTGETEVSDSRWLGSRVWPLETGGRNTYLIERERMGKGRQETCGCQHQGSVECVRFHIAEKRMRVKREIGLAFHRWKFDKMGEEVALSWTKEEEKKFQKVISSNPPSLDKSFWDEMFKSFPSKSREELVSYYFNVFLLQRRACQNRSSPSNIDSDDEESEFGLLTNGFGHKAIKSPGSIFCSPKKPHLKLR